MAEDDKPKGLTRSRLFILIFFGLAIAISISTILATWDEQRNGVAPTSASGQAATPPAK